MKALIIAVVVILVVFILFQFYTIMSANKTEEQKYTLILKEKDFEIRFYPSATIATIRSDADSYKELAGPGFRKLAGYISGGNKAGTEIPMTAPVRMDINDSISTMSFVMPSVYDDTDLPKPIDPEVIISRTADEYVAVLRFSGFATDKDLKSYSKKLQTRLQEKGITASGHYQFLGYNPPFQFIDRRNEIVVPIDWKEK